MKRLMLLLATALLGLGCQASAREADTARARLDAFAHDLHSLSGHFSQKLIAPSGKVTRSAGTLALEAPREFRWDTDKPFKQTIVADGSRVWLYDPELEQVTVRKQSTEESHSPLTVLTDISQLDRNFKVTERGAHDGLLWLRLTSTAANPQFEYADLGFDAHGLAQMEFRDQLNATTQISFSDWQRNQPLPAATFNFVPPPGTDVIGDAPVLSTHPLQN